METDPKLEENIVEWRSYLSKHDSIQTTDLDELEDHLRSQIDTLNEVGLDQDEAFFIAVKRLGDNDSISREFAQEYSERLWKQLSISDEPESGSNLKRRDAIIAIVLALVSGMAIKLPELFGHSIDAADGSTFYLRNISLFVLPFLTIFFVWKRRINRLNIFRLAIPFIAGTVLINILPFRDAGHTMMLAAIHLPIALWLVVGFAYMSGIWRNHNQRMNFIRFSGEWFIYYALIAMGGCVLLVTIIFIFRSIGIDPEFMVEAWILPCGIMGAVIIAGWLVEAKQSIIENIAPVLTHLFTPFFAILLVTFLGTMIFTGRGINVEREVLIGFDLLLVLVLALLLYSISVRDPRAKPGLFDYMQLLLIVSAFIVDILALWAISARISEWGFTPNKVAALGENIILLVNLGWSILLYTRFIMRRSDMVSIQRWQTSYIPVYGIWAWIVVAIFPIIFKFQ
jgi:hypothetical protein